MTGMLRHRLAHRSHDRAPVFCPDEEFDVLGPRQRDQDAHPGSHAAIEKPARRQMINARDVDPEFPHLEQIAAGLLGRAQVMPVGIRSEWP
jgi:hypothetical protein